MDRRSFLKGIGAAVLAVFLPKAKAIEEEERDAIYLPQNPDQKMADFLTSLECSGSEDWSIREPCDAHDLSETVDPLDAYIEPYPSLQEALEEIQRVCCDPDLWRMPIEYTIVVSPEQFDLFTRMSRDFRL